jgi:hypothetical protein
MTIQMSGSASLLAGLAKAQAAQSVASETNLESAVQVGRQAASKVGDVNGVDASAETRDRDGHGQAGYPFEEPPTRSSGNESEIAAPTKATPPPDLEGRGVQLDLQA